MPWRGKWQPTPVLLPGRSHGWRSPVGYSPWGHKRVRHDLATKQQHYSVEPPIPSCSQSTEAQSWREIISLLLSILYKDDVDRQSDVSSEKTKSMHLMRQVSFFHTEGTDVQRASLTWSQFQTSVTGIARFKTQVFRISKLIFLTMCLLEYLFQRTGFGGDWVIISYTSLMASLPLFIYSQMSTNQGKFRQAGWPPQSSAWEEDKSEMKGRALSQQLVVNSI